MNIEQFIRQNRQAMDHSLPDAHRWKGLERALDRYNEGDALERSILLDRIMLDDAEPGPSVWAGIEQTLQEMADCAAKPADCVDPLERFLTEHRADLDIAEPPANLWPHIQIQVVTENKQPGRLRINRLNWSRHLLRAAAAITLLLTGISIGLWLGNQEGGAMAMGEVSTEYAELEDYYQREIAVKQVRLANYNGSQPAEVGQDLQQLDLIMEELRRELANVPPGNREQIVRAMIENYKAKTAILERVLERLEETQTKTNNSGKNYEIKNI